MRSPFDKKITFIHHGHIGDIIAFLPVFQAMNGTHLVIRDDPWINPPMSGFRYESVKPLLESQGINVSFNSAENPIDHDTSGWRECYRHDISLTDSQARYMGIVDRNKGHMNIKKPWIKVEPDVLTKRRVIFNRTPRYRNDKFDWCSVHKHFADRALFIGTKDEHKAYIKEVGNIEHYETPSCLDVAKAIQGSDFFVGNQSSSCWIAMGLHKPLLQETFNPAPNSIIKYKGAWYGFDENIPLDKLEK